jgi:hypothetical protein
MFSVKKMSLSSSALLNTYSYVLPFLKAWFLSQDLPTVMLVRHDL